MEWSVRSLIRLTVGGVVYHISLESLLTSHSFMASGDNKSGASTVARKLTDTDTVLFCSNMSVVVWTMFYMAWQTFLLSQFPDKQIG